jgi:hypothetical protein
MKKNSSAKRRGSPPWESTLMSWDPRCCVLAVRSGSIFNRGVREDRWLSLVSIRRLGEAAGMLGGS